MLENKAFCFFCFHDNASILAFLPRLGFLALAILCFSQNRVFAQYDSTYVKTYKNEIGGRFYFSRKYTDLTLHNSAKDYKIHYSPNSPLNAGIGATYRYLTINAVYGFGFLNPGREERGKTKYLDLQMHNYLPKWVVDGYGQFYKGYYLKSRNFSVSPESYYIRPDLSVVEVGASGQYMFNGSRFSYGSSFLQNAWQKKSAGTFLLGFEGIYSRVKGDSSIVPANVDPDFAGQNFKKLWFFQLGPNVGYGYTLVVQGHYFISGTASVSLNYGWNTWGGYETSELKSSGFSSNLNLRFFAGYNSEKWSVGLIYVNKGVTSLDKQLSHHIELNTGNYRLCFVHRFEPGKGLKKFLKILP